jgi:hypothetical protein
MINGHLKTKNSGAWCSGHRRLQRNIRLWVRILTGCKVFRNLCIAIHTVIVCFLVKYANDKNIY